MTTQPQPVPRAARTATRLLVGLAATVATAVAPHPGAAQDATPARVLVVLASEDAGQVDPALRNVAALQRPPFNTFRSMRVLDRTQVGLRRGTPGEVSLPNGRKLRISLEQVLPDGRFRVKVSINRPNQADYLPLLTVVASPGEPFFVAGQSHQGGTLVVGVYVGPERS